MAIDVSNIKKTVEALRLERFPNIPPDLVEKIIQAAADHQEESLRREALTNIRRAVDEALAG